MGWLDDLLGKKILLNGTPVADRKLLNFLSATGVAITVVDNPSTSVSGYIGSTDVTFSSNTGIIGTGAVALTAANNGATLINSAAVVWDLPAAALGLAFRVINAVAAGTTLQTSGSDTITLLGLVSSAGGTFFATDVGSSMLLVGAAGGWYVCGTPLGGWSTT